MIAMSNENIPTVYGSMWHRCQPIDFSPPPQIMQLFDIPVFSAELLFSLLFLKMENSEVENLYLDLFEIAWVSASSLSPISDMNTKAMLWFKIWKITRILPRIYSENRLFSMLRLFMHLNFGNRLYQEPHQLNNSFKMFAFHLE